MNSQIKTTAWIAEVAAVVGTDASPTYSTILASETESNDTRATANVVSLGSTIAGELPSSADVDYYALTLASPGALTLTFNRPNAAYSGYFTIRLEDANGVILGSATDAAFPQTLSVGAAQAGTYYARVGSYSGYYYMGTYSLTATHVAGAAGAYESEPNDTRGSADPLLLGASISGQLATDTDLDYYAVAVGARGVLNIAAGGGAFSPTASCTIQAEDANGAVLETAAISASPQNIGVDIAQAGTYYIRLGGHASSAPYVLSAASFTADQAPSGTVVIAGAAFAGQTLTASNDIADADGMGPVCYRWQESADGTVWSNVGSGATLTLAPQQAIGHQIRVIADYVDGLSYAEAVVSAPLPIVAEPDIAASILTTASLTSGASVTSVIDSASDQDYFKIQLSAGKAYQFDVNGNYFNGIEFNPYLKLHDAANTALRANNDGASVYPTSGSGRSTDAQIVFIAPESGSYYLEVFGYKGSTGTYQLSATELDSANYFQSILKEYLSWNPGLDLAGEIELTFSFPTTLPSGRTATDLPNFLPFSSEQQAAARQALLLISSYTDITFTEVANQSGQIRFGTCTLNGAAGVMHPTTTSGYLTRADVELTSNVPSNASPSLGTRGGETLLHEIGHALGLKHPSNYAVFGGTSNPPYLPASQDAVQFTIESYNRSNVPAAAPMVFDIAALQYLYGINSNTASGDTAYSFSANAISSIWDVGGNDTLDASTWTASVTLDLGPGNISHAGWLGTDAVTPGVGIAFGTWLENATGGSAKDKIIGNIIANTLSGGTGNDRLDGLGGNDRLLGGDGDDILIGSAGDDALDGGADSDTATYGGKLASYAITRIAGGYAVTDIRPDDGDDGSDTLSAIEHIAFADISVDPAGNSPPSGSVGIGGAAVQGQTLTASDSLLDADGLGTIGYQWQSSSDGANWSDLGSGPALDLGEAQVGRQIRVVARYIDSLGMNESLASNATGAVANINDAPSGTVGVGGTAIQGQTLTAISTLADADGLGTLHYQWRADGIAIDGANAQSFVPHEAQVGKSLSVLVRYTDGHGTPEAVASGAAGLVANINDPPGGSLRVNGTPVPGQTLTAASHLFDADGIGTIGFQWQSSNDGSLWHDIAGATAASLPLTADRLGQQLRALGAYTDGHGTAEAIGSAPIAVVEFFPARTANLLVYAWKSHVALNEVMIGPTGARQATASDGSASFAGLTDATLALDPSRAIPGAEAAATDQAVNLQDAIAVLKMIVGLDANGAGKPLSPYQAYAADFDGNGAVNLNDAIGVLKHVVGLASPNPRWEFFNEENALALPNALAPGAVPPIGADLPATTSPIHLGLVGVLRGDVDGGFAGISETPDLDLSHPTYFDDLTATQGLNPSQFGLYPA